MDEITPIMRARGVKVTALDLEHPEDRDEAEIMPGNYVCIPVEPLYLDRVVRHEDGTIVLTLKRRT
jgi:hypothetical protein